MVTPPVPDRHNKQTRFLAGLAQGKSPAEAAALTDVPLPTFYTWRTKHTRFREAWEKAAAYGHTPSFPSPAQLAAINLEKPKSHWLWLPGGSCDGDIRPGDWFVIVLRGFGGGPEHDRLDELSYLTVEPDGSKREHSRGPSNRPMPEGVEHPAFLMPPDYMKRLPPKPRPRSRQ